MQDLLHDMHTTMTVNLYHILFRISSRSFHHQYNYLINDIVLFIDNISICCCICGKVTDLLSFSLRKKNRIYNCDCFFSTYSDHTDSTLIHTGCNCCNCIGNFYHFYIYPLIQIKLHIQSLL